MTDAPFKWTCIKCDNEISQYQEYCAECEEKQYRKIGGFLYLPLLNLFILAYSYFSSLQITLQAGLYTAGRAQIAQSSYFFIASGVNFIALLYIFYTTTLFVRKKKHLPLAYTLLLAVGVAIMLLDLVCTKYLFPEIPLGYEQIMPIFRHIIHTCIWIPYFHYSVRVKKTFIR